MKLIKVLINSNIYISLAAVFLTIETQIQLGMKPHWHPYLLLIFFGTLLEYNLHRLITVFSNKEALNSDKHKWVRQNRKVFYVLILLSAAGSIFSALSVKTGLLIALSPIAVLTFFYSFPVFSSKQRFFRLREIPYLKIFLIAFVWATITILIPVIQNAYEFTKTELMIMIAERFFFIFAITIPFDIRDTEFDKKAGLKTIPLLYNENKSYVFSYLSLLIFFTISFFHYQLTNSRFIFFALSISALTTFIFLYSKRIRKFHYYHYGILDGTMLLQGLLILVLYYINLYFNL